MAINKVEYGGNTLIDLTGDTLESADQLLSGITAHARDGSQITGNIPDNGNVSATIDGLTVDSVEIPAGYTTGGTVSLTSDIEEALAAI